MTHMTVCSYRFSSLLQFMCFGNCCLANIIAHLKVFSVETYPHTHRERWLSFNLASSHLICTAWLSESQATGPEASARGLGTRWISDATSTLCSYLGFSPAHLLAIIDGLGSETRPSWCVSPPRPPAPFANLNIRHADVKMRTG